VSGMIGYLSNHSQNTQQANYTEKHAFYGMPDTLQL